MAYSYSTEPVTYNSMNYSPYYSSSNKKNSALRGAVIGAGIGVVGSTIVAVKKNSYITPKGEVYDSFAKTVHKKFIKEADSETKTSFKQSEIVLKKLKKIKKADDLKKLLQENETFTKKFFNNTGETADSFLKNIDEKNLKDNIKNIKNKIEAENDLCLQNIKNKIKACWDETEKKYVESKIDDSNFFKILKKAQKTQTIKDILKTSSFMGLLCGVLGVIGGLMLSE